MAKRSNRYFEDFIIMADHSCKAADLLHKTLLDFNPDTLPAKLEEMHVIEHEADESKHSIMERLVKEFVPPIDREDIIHLANELDNVTDKIEDILMRIDMYNLQKLLPAAMEFAAVIAQSCVTLRNAMVEFPNFHKSAAIRQAIIEVNNMEERGDAIYFKAMRELYRSDSNPVEISTWSKLFDRFEDCCDACEHVSDTMNIIIMKNS